MGEGPVGFTVEQQNLLWAMWRRGDSIREMERTLGETLPRIRRFLRQSGGNPPVPRQRRASHLTLVEREEISRGIAAGLTARSIAGRIGQATPYPVIIAEQRAASRQALVAYRGNRYSVPPELAMATVTVTRPLGGQFIDIAIPAGIIIARRKLLADGLGATVRDSGHVVALDAAAMGAANCGRPHRRKERIPPGPEALAAAAELRDRLAAWLSRNTACR